MPVKPAPVEGAPRDDSPPLYGPIVVDRRKKEYRDKVLAQKKEEAKAATALAAKEAKTTAAAKGENQVARPVVKPAVARYKVATRFKKAISTCMFPRLSLSFSRCHPC